MDHLNTLIADLSETEKSEFTEWLKGREKKDKTLHRKLGLFNQIAENADVSDKKLSSELFQSLPDNNLMHLKRETYKSLLNFIYHTNLRKNERENKAAQAERNCHMYLDVARSLLNRGLNENAKNVIQNVQQVCEKYELFLIKIKANSLYRECIGNQIGDIAYEEVTHSIRDDIRGIENYLRVFEMRDRALNPTPFMLEQKEEYISMLEESIEYLMETKLQTHSPVIELRYLEVMARYCEVNSQWKESYTLLQKGYRLIRENPALQNEYWTRHISFKLSELALYLRKYDEAQRHISDLMRMTNPRTLDYTLLLQRFFRISLHAGKWKDAEHAIEQVNVKKILRETNWQRFILWQLNRAALLLLSDNAEGYTKAMNTARRHLPNTKSTPVSLLYLECLYFLKTGELDKLEMRIQMLTRKLRGEPDTHRWKSILRVLKETVKKYGNYFDLEEKTFIALYSLVRETKWHSWNCLGEEIIHFGSFFSDIYREKTRKNLDEELTLLRQKVKNNS